MGSESMQGVQEEIVGDSVVLRPYLRQFVEKYHSWMVCSWSLLFNVLAAQSDTTASPFMCDVRRRIPFFVSSQLQSPSRWR